MRFDVVLMLLLLMSAKVAGVALTALEGHGKSTSATFSITRQASMETGSFLSNRLKMTSQCEGGLLCRHRWCVGDYYIFFFVKILT